MTSLEGGRYCVVVLQTAGDGASEPAGALDAEAVGKLIAAASIASPPRGRAVGLSALLIAAFALAGIATALWIDRDPVAMPAGTTAPPPVSDAAPAPDRSPDAAPAPDSSVPRKPARIQRRDAAVPRVRPRKNTRAHHPAPDDLEGFPGGSRGAPTGSTSM